MTFMTLGLSSNISSWYSARCIAGEKIIELGLDCNRIPATFSPVSERPASRVPAFPVVVFMDRPGACSSGTHRAFLFGPDVGFRPRNASRAPDASSGDTLSLARHLDKSPSETLGFDRRAWGHRHSGSAQYSPDRNVELASRNQPTGIEPIGYPYGSLTHLG